MKITFSEAQKNRLTELGMKENETRLQFETVKEREMEYKKIEKSAVAKNREKLMSLTESIYQPKLCKLQQDLINCLLEEKFTQVTTPSTITRKFLERMSIEQAHPLYNQVFWLDDRTCLRPMLAPNLYEISQKMMNYCKMPLKIFEIGSCFRKESEGKSHLKEFTMLNLVEWGTPVEDRVERLKELVDSVLKAAHISEYGFENEDSLVYGIGLDVIGNGGLELASTSMGPHPLDSAWRVSSSWVGAGFGLERLLMYREGEEGIHRYSKSISFLDGARLNIK
ncbi:UNVERIFIED_CONTAM: pyrrolysyl-tRNA synthetase [Acetivibrio alkalicellulosi]